MYLSFPAAGGQNPAADRQPAAASSEFSVIAGTIAARMACSTTAVTRHNELVAPASLQSSASSATIRFAYNQHRVPASVRVRISSILINDFRRTAQTAVARTRNSCRSRPAAPSAARVVVSPPMFRPAPAAVAQERPKPAKPEPNMRPKTRLFLGRARDFG